MAALLWMINESDVLATEIECVFSDTGNEHEWTYEHIRRIDREVHPVTWLKPELDFYELALKHKRFPSPKARFCTQMLKIKTCHAHIKRRIAQGYKVISVSGVRADESPDRKKLDRHDFWEIEKGVVVQQYRPLIDYKIEDVYKIHNKYGFPLNPLYAMGAKRVGCFPCIMSRKAEIRMIALQFPDRIDMIRNVEQEFERRYGRYSSFFSPKTVPPHFRTKPFIDSAGNTVMVATIDDVVNWSMTGKRARGHYTDNVED
ncbi:MAG: phosphoadenosine phosphosulfate reductase family protein [Pontiellaceae bacterium]|nr:phosphoadenosine phosphosulfate reductase family protein [Pontiellaceae bacterium]